MLFRSVIAGADGPTAIATWAHSPCVADWLRGHLALPNGIPAKDTYRRVLQRLQPEAFQRCFEGWLQSLIGSSDVRFLAIDGKTLRRSHDRSRQNEMRAKPALPERVRSMEGLGRAGPLDLHLAMLRKTVAQVQVDEALVGDASLASHALEVVNDVFRKTHSDWLLELGCVRVLTRTQLGEIVFSLHARHLGSARPRASLLSWRR